MIEIPAPLKNLRLVNIRWTFYKNFLLEHGDDYAQVLVADVRDLIFQGDLFNQFDQYASYLGYSTEQKIIDGESINTGWIISLYGVEEYHKIKHCKIVCGGTLWGTSDALLMFANEMCNQLIEDKDVVDQAAANYIIHNKLLPIENIIESDANTGTVLTVGWEITEIRGDKILNSSGGVPTVVHQYDRHPAQLQFVESVYRTAKLPFIDNFDDFTSRLDVIEALIPRNRLTESINKLMYLLDMYPEPNDWRDFLNRMRRIFEITMLNSSSSLKSEMIGHIVCAAFMQTLNARSIDFDLIIAMHRHVMIAKQRQHEVYKPFEKIVATLYFQLISNYEQSGDLRAAAFYLERLMLLDYPNDENFYLMAARINRKIGNKDKAREFYDKLLTKN